MFEAIRDLHTRVIDHIENLRDKQPWENRNFFEFIEESLGSMISLRPLPRYFAGGIVKAAVKIADAEGMMPHRHVVLTQDTSKRVSFGDLDVYNVHTIAWDGKEWTTAGNGHYRMTFDRAMHALNEKVTHHGAPNIER